MKMKKLNRILSIVLAGVLCISVVACGSSSSSSSDDTEDTSTEDTSTEETTQEVSEEEAGETTEEETTNSVIDDESAYTATSVTYWMDPQNMSANTVSSFDDHVGWQTYEENLGIDIIWQEPASGQSTEQFNLIIATDDLPDIMYYSWLTSYPGGPDQAIADGKIIALNDYIEEYAPNFYAYLQAHPDVAKEITTDSGNIYCFPAIYTYTSEDSDVWQGVLDREPYDETYIGLLIRTDLLEEAGLDIPVTLDDWYEALVAFKEMGIEYPLSCQVTFLTMAQSFVSAYDITTPVIGYSSMTTGFYIDDDGNVQYGPAQDDYYEYLSFLNKLYEEGLLDPDFMVQERSNVQSKVLNGQVGAWIGMMPTDLGNLKSQILAEDPDSTFYGVGVLNPVLNEGDELTYKSGNLAYIGSGAAITTSCEDIATACKVLDYAWSEEGNMILNWGIEGVSYEMVDGWPALTDSIINNDDGLAASEAFSLYRNLNGPYPMDHSQRLVSKTDYTLAEDEIDENIAALDTWSSSANGTVTAGMPSTTMLTEEATTYSTAYSELSTYVEEMFAKFVMGTESLDNFSQFQNYLDSMGLETVLELQQTALDRYYER